MIEMFLLKAVFAQFRILGIDEKKHSSPPAAKNSKKEKSQFADRFSEEKLIEKKKHLFYMIITSISCELFNF